MRLAGEDLNLPLVPFDHFYILAWIGLINNILQTRGKSSALHLNNHKDTKSGTSLNVKTLFSLSWLTFAF